MNDATIATIREQLRVIEAEKGVRVLFACESGSRAWGFESRDSDYDVRFVYAHDPEWYLSLRERRDVIEKSLQVPRPGPTSRGSWLDLDMSGWDVRKALRLFRKGNPPLLEWVNSPVVYADNEGLRRLVAGVQDEFFSPSNSLHHYRGMAGRNFKEYLKGPRVRTKKYLYVLRPLMAMLFLEETHLRPPVDFYDLMGRVEHLVPRAVLAQTKELVRKKRAGHELEMGPRIPALNEWIEGELERDVRADSNDRVDLARLDEIFRIAITERSAL